jgi:sugar phosphate permease
MVAVAFPMAWFVKEKRDHIEKGNMSEKASMPFQAIFKSWPFYILVIGSMCSIGAVAGTSQNVKLFLSLDLKYSQEQAANIMSIVLGASIVGRLVMGWLADRMEKKYVMIIIYSLVAVSIPLLYFTSTPGIVYIFAFIFGVALGGDYMIIPLMAAELFGVKVMGRVMGLVITMDGIAEALAPMLAARIRDVTGSYANGFAALIVLAVVGTIAVMLLPSGKAVSPK